MTSYFATDYNDIVNQISKYYYYPNSNNSNIYYSFNGSSTNYFYQDFHELTKDELLKEPSNLLFSCFSSKEVNFEKFYIKVTSYDGTENLVGYTLLVDTPFSKIGYNIENRIVSLEDFNNLLNNNTYDFSTLSSPTYYNIYSKLVLTNNNKFETVIFKTGDSNLFPILNYYYSHTVGNDGRIFLNAYANDKEKVNTEGKVGLLRCDGTFKYYPIELWDELVKYHKVFKYEVISNEIDYNILFTNFWRLVKEDINFYENFKGLIKKLSKHEGDRYNYVSFLKNNLFYKIDNNDVRNFINFESDLTNRFSKLTRNLNLDTRYTLDKYIRKAFRNMLNEQIKYTLEENHEENE